MIKDDIGRLLRASNAMSSPQRNLQRLESIIISEGWSNVPINDSYGSSDRTMLHLAVQADVDGTFIEVIKFLIKNGINVNAQDSRGNTVLHYIAAGNSVRTDSQYEIAKLILDNGGNLNILNDNKMSALRSTITHCQDNHRLMRLFLKYEISDDVLDDLERSAKIVGYTSVLEMIEQRKS